MPNSTINIPITNVGFELICQNKASTNFFKRSLILSVCFIYIKKNTIEHKTLNKCLLK